METVSLQYFLTERRGPRSSIITELPAACLPPAPDGSGKLRFHFSKLFRHGQSCPVTALAHRWQRAICRLRPKQREIALAAFSAVNFPIAAKRNRSEQLAQSIQHSTEILPQVGYLRAGAYLGLLEA